MTETNKEDALINADREAYLAYRQSLDNAELEVSGRYDKWVLTLSGGALGLSITFLEKIAPSPEPATFWLLPLSWSLFILSILAALISLLTSQSAIREMRDSLDDGHDLKPSKCYGVITNCLNWLSAIFFIAGAAAFCFFTFENLPNEEETKERLMSEEEFNIPQNPLTEVFVQPAPPDTKGFVPPQAPKPTQRPSKPQNQDAKE